jgi:hypothetical protein
MNLIISILTEKIKFLGEWGSSHENELYVGVVVICASAISFGLGRLSLDGVSSAPIEIKDQMGAIVLASTTRAFSETATVGASGVGVAAVETPSTSGFIVGTHTSKKYRYPWCSGIESISEKNRVFFKTEADAVAAGYTLIKSCKPK